MTTETAPTIAGIALRGATLDDAPFVADLFTELWPDEPEDPVMTRHFWEHPWDNGTWERWVGSKNGRNVAFVAYGHAKWEVMPERYARLQGDVVPALRTADRLEALIDFAQDRAQADGALKATKWAREHDALQIEVLSKRGFSEARRERFWELDLKAQREKLVKMADESRARMREQGVRIVTLDKETDPRRYEKLWRMSEESQQDIPTTVPFTPTPKETFITWMHSPSVRESRVWIARLGDDYVGISLLGYPPVRGVVQTEYTGTARSVRGKGVARALKCETVMQAIALGTDRVRTDNDSENKPILHINEEMGYRPRPEMIQFIKELSAG